MKKPNVLLLIITDERHADTYRHIPAGPLRLKTYLERKDCTVDTALCTILRNEKDIETISLRETYRETEAGYNIFTAVDIVALSIISENIAKDTERMELLLGKIRKRIGNTPIVAGGFGVWDRPFQIAWAYKDIDFLVYKWGEIPLEFLAKKTVEGRIAHPITSEKKDWLVREKAPRGIYIRYVETKRTLSAESLETAGGISLRSVEVGLPGVHPTGGWEQIPLEARYYISGQKPHLEMTTQLGCGYGECSFCEWAKSTEHWPEKQEDKEDVVKWALANIMQCRPTLLTINDACFLYRGGGNSIEILKGIKELREAGKLPKEFHVQYDCRADAFPRDRGEREKLIRLMVEAGTSGAYIGFESGSDRTLREFRKGTTLEQNVRAADALATAKLRELGGYFILTSPNSQIPDFAKTLQLMAYAAKKADSFKMAVVPTVRASHKNALCSIVPERNRESQIQKLLWPQDALLRALATTAHFLLDEDTSGQKQRHGDPFDVQDGDAGARREYYLNTLKEISALMDHFFGQPGPTQEGIDALKGRSTKAARICSNVIKREGLSENIRKDYVLYKKHDAPWNKEKGLTFAQAVMAENEKLKEIIRTKDRERARDVLLGKCDREFEERTGALQ